MKWSLLLQTSLCATMQDRRAHALAVCASAPVRSKGAGVPPGSGWIVDHNKSRIPLSVFWAVRAFPSPGVLVCTAVGSHFKSAPMISTRLMGVDSEIGL